MKIEESYLRNEILQKGRTYKDIAIELEISKDRIRYWALKYGILSKHTHNKKLPVDIIKGKIIRNWEIVSDESFWNKMGDKRSYLCKCVKCGFQQKVSLTTLRHSRGTKCHRCYGHYKGYGEIPSRVWANYASGAIRRNIPFDISIEYGWNLFLKQNRKCALSGIDIHFPLTSRDKFNASLDRIDSKLGYIEGNIQWVHKSINLMKHSLDENIFIDFCKLIVGHSGKCERAN